MMLLIAAFNVFRSEWPQRLDLLVFVQPCLDWYQRRL